MSYSGPVEEYMAKSGSLESSVDAEVGKSTRKYIRCDEEWTNQRREAVLDEAQSCFAGWTAETGWKGKE